MHPQFSDILNILNNSFIIFFYALFAGLIPALLWLWFWLHEKDKHKEPVKVIFMVFLLGMLGVFVSFILQKALAIYFDFKINDIGNFVRSSQNHQITNLIFVIIEEFIKFLCAYTVFFRTKVFDEPIDAFIYLMTAALGFAAMENSLYLVNPLINGDTINVIISSNLRFIGANVLHVASSGLLALFIGYAFYKGKIIKELYTWIGLIFAVLLHWMFNILLINHSNSTLFIFLSVWVVIIFLILSLEKIKNLRIKA